MLLLFLIVSVRLLVKPEVFLRLSFAMLLSGAFGALFLLSGIGARYGGATNRLLYEGFGVNAISISLGMCLVAGLVYLHAGENRKFKVLGIILMILIYQAILHTGSRSVIWGVPIAIVGSYVLASGRGFRYRVIAVFVLGILFVALSWATTTGYLAGSLQDRVLLRDRADIQDNVRYTMWRQALTMTSLVLGGGPGNKAERDVFLSEFLIGEAHNTFVSTLMQTGAAGASVLIVAIGFVGFAVVRLPNVAYRLPGISMFIYFLIQLNKGSVLQTRLFWYPMIFIILLSSLNLKAEADWQTTLESKEDSPNKE
jgi:hypothetical protein